MPGGKVGGVGDVVRDLPAALIKEGWRATVLTPSYGSFHTLPGARALDTIGVAFREEIRQVDVYEIVIDGVPTVLFDHAALAPTTPGLVYHDDGSMRPYATDANKFAFFCAAAAKWITALPDKPGVVHLHDWHAAYYLLQRDYSPLAADLDDLRTVFTIHNLAYQGQRPLEDDDSSLESWFPGMEYEADAVGDPEASGCINPMAFAIRKADSVNTVSPTYAQEIQCPSVPEHGFIGGEGLENDLVDAANHGRLHGILNGCDYSINLGRRPGWQRLVLAGQATVEAWLSREPDNADHELARRRLGALPKRRPLHVLTSIGRIVTQKIQLFLQPLPDGRSALEHLLDNLGHRGVMFLLGSGNTEFEDEIASIAGEHDNLVFLRGYSEAFGDLMYHGGDLFLMPSSFEPCGISQMLAMRAGQPCVVHGVGGLHDTVASGETGFVFAGETPIEQAQAFVDTVGAALALRRDRPNRWQRIREQAAAQRFDWRSTARQYIEQMYEHDRDRH